MAHDVRTPLNAMTATNENLKMVIKDPECLSMIELSESSCYILLNMFDQIQELQKMKFNQLKLHYKLFDLREMLMSLFNKMRIQAEFLSLNMHLKIEQSLPKSIYTDQERLERVIFVLLQNSLKYTQHGWIKLIAELGDSEINECGAGASSEKVRIEFTVIDTGSGISEADQLQMF